MDKPWKVLLAFIGVFIAGAVFGGLFTLRATGKRLAQPVAPKTAVPAQVQSAAPKAPANPGPAIMRQFTRKLKPTPEQREKIEPLITRAGEDLQRIGAVQQAQWRENLENSTRVYERLYEDVSGWLTPEQRIELAEMRRQWQEIVARERKRRAVPPAKAPIAADAAKMAPPRGTGP